MKYCESGIKHHQTNKQTLKKVKYCESGIKHHQTNKQTLKKGMIYKQIKQSKTTNLANLENKTSTVTSRNLCPKLGQAQKCGGV